MGLKTSANYDYTDPISIAQKEIEDKTWIDEQMEIRGVDPIHRMYLKAQIRERDLNAEDNFMAKEHYYDRLEFAMNVGGYVLPFLTQLKNMKVKSLFHSDNVTVLKNLLKKDSFTPKKYEGNSTAEEYILNVKGGNKYSVVLNYGGGRHGGAMGKNPYYYKITGPNYTPTKIIDPAKYPRSEWINQRKWRIIDGNTGNVLKEAGKILKQ